MSAPRPADESSTRQRRWVSTREAAEILGLSPRTLESLRTDGGGPPYLAGPRGRPVRYELGELYAWADRHTRRSTSDRGAAA